MNDEVGSGNKPFVIKEDPFSLDVKSLWVKVRCSYCDQYMSLCPPNETLESNLKNHIAGTKHERIVADADSDKSKGSAIRSGRRGRPSTSGSLSGGVKLNYTIGSDMLVLQASQVISILQIKVCFYLSCAGIIGFHHVSMLVKYFPSSPCITIPTPMVVCMDSLRLQFMSFFIIKKYILKERLDIEGVLYLG